MRIAVVAHALRSAGGLSVGRNLIEALVSVGQSNPFYLVVPRGIGYEDLSLGTRNVSTHAVGPQSPARRMVFDRTRLRNCLASFDPDVILALDSSHSMVNPPAPQAVLVNAAHLVYPRRNFGPRSARDRIRHQYLGHHFRRALGDTRSVFVQTNVMAARLRRAYDFKGSVSVVGTAVPRTLTDVTPEALDPALSSVFDGDDFRLLYVTRYYPHKNIEAIVDTFARYRKELSRVTVYLTVAPDQHPNVRRVLKRIESLGLESRIINLGELPAADIAACYRNCDALLMPTTLECFSTTYAEAMDFNLPILTSNLDFARESCGDAAVYFDPWDPATIKDAILTARDDPQLRERMAQAGRQQPQAGRTWAQIAATMLAGLADIAERRPD